MEQAQAGQTASAVKDEQYSLMQIGFIWLLGGLPMWVLGWIIYPMVAEGLGVAEAGLWRLRLLTVGLVWQFVLSTIILYREAGDIRIETIRRRFWLNNPVSPKTGEKKNRLWWLLIPFGLLLFAFEAVVSPFLNDLWLGAFPFLAAPPGFTPDALFTPDLLPGWVGHWELFILAVLLAVFNTFLGEEFLFHGVLLPKMAGTFGKWDWVANGVLFAAYHLHQPWGIPGNLLATLLFAYTGRTYRSNWFPIILHSIQSVILIVLVLGIVLGLA